ncbi:MAG: hypothetical protein M3042_10530 [Actinomycetota bacterium]|nr:hypothetical protein [Actinomycetota bacterium]
MSRPPVAPAGSRGRRPSLLLLVAGTLAALLGACSSGQIAQTARDVSAVEGSSASRGGVGVRDARIAEPPGGSYSSGGDAPMLASIVTDDKTSDTLMRVTSDAADSVTVTTGSSGSPSAATSASASAAPSASASSADSTLDVKLDAGTLLVFGGGGGGGPGSENALNLVGLRHDLSPGMTVRVTFSFAQAGDITLNVPVATPDVPEPRLSPSPSAEGG